MKFRERMVSVKNFCFKNAKIVFPVILVIVVAITVSIALSAHHEKEEDLQAQLEAQTEITETMVEETAEDAAQEVEDVPMQENQDQDIYSLICTYYNAWAYGDSDTLYSVCDVISDQDILRFVETSKYIDHYAALEVFTKPGPEAGSTIAFVYYRVIFADYEDELPAYQAHYICTDENGKLYIKRGDNTPEVDEAIQELISQDDVVEFNNKITVEYNNLIAEKPELLDYLSELDNAVSIAVGEQLAQLNVETEGEQEESSINETPDDQIEETAEEALAEVNKEQFAKATTTVNVRSSDSENADKLGKVSGGTQLKILEVKMNGWTKVDYDGKEGYIKSEYLEIIEAVSDSDIIGTVTATTNINVRSQASQTASRLGVLAGGDSVELLARENGWCKIVYNGQVGYVKEDYVN